MLLLVHEKCVVGSGAGGEVSWGDDLYVLEVSLRSPFGSESYSQTERMVSTGLVGTSR